jgi:hypothetical protein
MPQMLAPPIPCVSGRRYALLLTTTDSGEHILTLEFPHKITDGVADLGAVRDFNPREQSLAGFAQALMLDRLAALGRLNPEAMKVARQVEGVEGGGVVVLAHVTSYRYLGEVIRTGAGPRLRIRDDLGVRDYAVPEHGIVVRDDDADHDEQVAA